MFRLYLIDNIDRNDIVRIVRISYISTLNKRGLQVASTVLTRII